MLKTFNKIYILSLLTIHILLTPLSSQAQSNDGSAALNVLPFSENSQLYTGHFDQKSKNIILAYMAKHHYHSNSFRAGLNRECMLKPNANAKNCREQVFDPVYTIGERLPVEIPYNPLPTELARMLPISPPNTSYGIIDNDVILISNITRLLLDSVVMPPKIAQK